MTFGLGAGGMVRVRVLVFWRVRCRYEDNGRESDLL